MEPHFFMFGERGSGIRAPSSSAVQDFSTIKTKYLERGQLFTDHAFPADDSSLYFGSSDRTRRNVVWKRASQLSDDPQFIKEDASRFDVMQGELGDCWLLAAIANLTMNQKLFHRVVPRDQSFNPGDYAGVFHFRFWQYGKWIDIVVDDYLPTLDGEQLLYMHSKDDGEYWSPLLEKAYAKLHGSYAALKGGTTCEAMEDFTGGLTEYYDIQGAETPSNLYQIMLKAYERCSFMGCSIDALDASQIENKLPNGLVKGHAYSVTSVKLIELSSSRVSGKIPLLRIRNPWGNEAEWNGPWSDGSREWSLVSSYERTSLNLNFDSDGEFWISYKDWKENFTRLEICNLSPEGLTDEDSARKKHWEAVMFEGSWIKGLTAGGCRNNLSTFGLNPQYMITLKDHDEDDNDNLCTLIVALMQKNHRAKRKMGQDSLTIGFAIYKVDEGGGLHLDHPLSKSGYFRENHQLLTVEFFKYNASVARSPTFINLREITSRFQLSPGCYCIIPSTFDAGEEGEFILRIFTEKAPESVLENDDDVFIQDENSIDNQPTPKPVRPPGMDDIPTIDEVPIYPSAPRRDSLPEPNVRVVGPNTGNSDLISDIVKLLTFCWSTYQTVNESFIKPNLARNTDSAMEPMEGNVQEIFYKVAGQDMELDSEELQQVLNTSLKKEFRFEGSFSLDSCRSMIALYDGDHSGHLGLDEFSNLWNSIRKWAGIFHKHDADQSNNINAHELREAFNESGFHLNRNILKCLLLRYGKRDAKNREEGERSISFDDFVHCCIKLKFAIESFNCQQKVGSSMSKSGQKLGFESLLNQFTGGNGNAGNFMNMIGGMSGMPGGGNMFSTFMSNGKFPGGQQQQQQPNQQQSDQQNAVATFSMDDWVQKIMYS